MSYNALFGLGSHAVDASLDAHWLLQETSGTSAADSSGNGNTLTIVGMGSDPTVDTGPNTWLPSAFEFDGIDDRLNSAGSISSGDDQSILMWMKRTLDPPVTGTKAGFCFFGEGTALSAGSAIPYSDDTHYCAMLRGTDAINNTRVIFSPSAVDLTAWRKVSFRTTPGADGWQFYIDGVEEQAATGLTGVYSSNTTVIGKSSFDAYFEGLFAGIACFSRKLSDAEEADAFAGPEPLSTGPPTLLMGPTSWTGTTGTWNSQNNGTISCAWELRLTADDSVVESGTAAAGASIGDSGTYSGLHYLYVRASNDGGFDAAEDQESVDVTPAADTLTFTDSADSVVTSQVSATDTLALSEDGDAEFGNPKGNESLTFSETATCSGTFAVSASDTVVFTDSSFAAQTHVVGAEDAVSFADSAYMPTRAMDALSLAETAIAGVIIPVSVSDALTLTEAITRAVVVHGNATDALAFEEEEFDPDTLTVSTVEGGLRDLAEVEYTTSTATTYSVSATDELTTTDVATSGGTYAVSASDTLGVTDAVASTVQDVELCEYDEAQAGPYPSASGVGGFTLRYPSTGSVTDSVTLRNPNLGNKHRISPHRINRLTRGGDLVIYRDPSWPLVEALLVQFSSITRVKALELQTFIQDHLGEEISLIDWEDREWIGVIVVVDDPVVQDKKGDCSYTMSFEFEGALA